MIKLISKLPVFSSMRSKLITLLLVLVGLPLFIAGYLSYQSATDALLKQTTQQLGNLAEKTGQLIDNFFLSVKKDINLLANYPFIQLAFLQYEFQQRLDTVQRLLADYRNKNNYFTRIYLVGLDGRPILAVPQIENATLDFHKTHWFDQTVKNGLHLSDGTASSSEGPGAIYLGKTIFDYENPLQPVGVLAFEIRTTAYTDFIRSLNIGSGGYAMLIHHGGQVIDHPDPALQTIEDVIQIGDSRLVEHIGQMTQGNSGYGRYAFAGDKKFLVYTACQQMPWSVGITVQERGLMADINRFQQKMQTFFLVIIVLIMPISYLFIKSLTRPIKQLKDGASRIGSGDLDQSICIKSNDELSGVADEFNKMAVQLKSSMNEILDLKNFNEDILRNVTSGIITVNRKGTITSFNAGAAKILGYRTDTLVAATPDAPSKNLKPILDVLAETLDTGNGVHHREMAISRPNQDRLHVEINTSMLSSMTGKVFGAIADIRDITQRKRMEEVMLRVEKLASLGELSAGMAHEIRNPLAGIKTSVQVLFKRVTKPQSKELLSGIESEINRLNKFVTDLLRFSRPAPAHLEPVTIAKILDTTLDLMAERIRAQRIVIEKRIDKRLPKAVVDKEQMRQVILNLLINSIKAMESGGQLSVEVVPAMGDANGNAFPTEELRQPLFQYIKVVLADSGRGIDPHHLNKIFDPFFTTDPKGTGLGLAIAHKLIEKNNGYIFIDSIKDEGTRAILLLPTALPTGEL